MGTAPVVQGTGCWGLTHSTAKTLCTPKRAQRHRSHRASPKMRWTSLQVRCFRVPYSGDHLFLSSLVSRNGNGSDSQLFVRNVDPRTVFRKAVTVALAASRSTPSPNRCDDRMHFRKPWDPRSNHGSSRRDGCGGAPTKGRKE